MHLKPSVVATRRLGNSQTNRPQLLRVVLATSDQAGDIQRRTKLLRASSDEVIRKSVYINPDLTPAERKSSYDQRCLRRHREATKSTSTSKSASSAISNPTTTDPTNTSAESSSRVDDRQRTQQLEMSFASAAVSTAISNGAMLNHSLIQTSIKPCTAPATLQMTSSAVISPSVISPSVISPSVIEHGNLATSPIDLSSSGSGLLSTSRLCQSSTLATANNQLSTTREEHLLQPTTTQSSVTESS